ncbi:hypothetical protein PoB_006329800 [Plakobranchus ocellatus]|uniref:Uncharacterized protein n=1 Tax=Plakobranchus ocellatus TaxID=259542 RepID=A0AAV4CY24_9GAST|nr:hypothetical protein PoB_006329800 [Plakobranchus ocellatus]
MFIIRIMIYLLRRVEFSETEQSCEHLVDTPFKDAVNDSFSSINAASGSGNGFILIPIDYATRYIVVMCKKIETQTVDEAFANIHSCSEEILSGMGA